MDMTVRKILIVIGQNIIVFIMDVAIALIVFPDKSWMFQLGYAVAFFIVGQILTFCFNRRYRNKMKDDGVT